LQQKKYAIDEIQQVLDVLMEEKLLSDIRFVTNYIHYRKNRGFGPMHIYAELRERGVDKEVIEEHLAINDNTWIDVVHALWQKRFKNQIPEDYKMRVKQMRFLLTRGFTREQIEYFYLNILEQ